MRILTFLFIFFSASSTKYMQCFGQLISAPNASINGKKQGLWNELEFLDSFSMNGTTMLLLGQHTQPLQKVAVGYYDEGVKTGIWKSFWIESYLDSNMAKYRKGPLHSIVDYHKGFKIGLFISYFKNGGIRLLGHYRKYENQSVDTFTFTHPLTAITADTVIVSKYDSKMIGHWHEFDSTGKLIQTIDYGQ